MTNESKNNRFPAYFNFMNKDEDEGNLRCLLGFEVQIQKPEDNSP